MVLLQQQHTSVITLQPRKLKLLEAMAGQGYALLGRNSSAAAQPTLYRWPLLKPEIAH